MSQDDQNKLIDDENYLVNLGSDQLSTVFASFYNILMEQVEGDKAQLFMSYMSFLIFEVKNYVGALINFYNYIFHQDYQIYGGLFKNILIQNFIDLTSRKLHRKFLDSSFWLSSDRIYGAYEYFNKLDRIEFLFQECLRHNVEFYQQLGQSSVSFQSIVDSANQLQKSKKEIQKLFEEQSLITENNVRLISLYLNYEMNINFK